MGYRERREQQQSQGSSKGGKKDFGPEVGLYEYKNEKKNAFFWKGTMSREFLDTIIRDFPNGCDVYMNEIKKGGEKNAAGKTIPHMALTFKPPYVKGENKQSSQSSSGNNNGHSGNQSGGRSDNYDDRP